MPSSTTPPPAEPRRPDREFRCRAPRRHRALVPLVRVAVMLAYWFLPETLIADVAHWFDELVRS